MDEANTTKEKLLDAIGVETTAVDEADKQIRANELILNEIEQTKRGNQALIARIDEIEAKLAEPQKFDDDISKVIGEMDIIKTQITDNDIEESALLKTLDRMKVITDMLKDDGIKSVVVSTYMPMLNKLVNEYLAKMNLDVLIEVTSEFEINIISPDRRNQSLSDLSSGQVRRVDLAVMMAWRVIGESTTSMSTNLLILDETLENLSSQGVSDFVDFFNASHSHTSLVVISQRQEEFTEYFDNEIRLTLDSEGFTKILTTE